MISKISNIIFPVLVSSIASFGQKVVDTTGRYNGEDTKERIEYARSGEVVKETWFYPDGRIEQENLYEDGAPYYWISYDQHGNRTAEWGDRFNTPGKWRKKRTRVLIWTGLCFAVLTVAAARKYYEFVFYTFFTLSLFFPLFMIFIEKQMRPGNKVQELIFSELLILLPSALLILAGINLIGRRTSIPVVLSVMAVIISVGILLFFNMVSNIAGAGILG